VVVKAALPDFSIPVRQDFRQGTRIESLHEVDGFRLPDEFTEQSPSEPASQTLTVIQAAAMIYA
jgi:hypothetical protein